MKMEKYLAILCWMYLALIISNCSKANTNTVYLNNNQNGEGIEFTDVQSHWAINEINFLVRNEVINGYKDNTFRPNQYISVSEFLKILVSISDYSLVVKDKLWPDSYIETAKVNGLIEDDEFSDYSAYISRYDVVKILCRYIETDDLKKAKNLFEDLNGDVNQDLKNDVLRLANLEIVNGYSDNTFRGENLVTRAEACKMIKKSYETKQKLFENREYKITSKNSNLKEVALEEAILDNEIERRNKYEIKNNRLYFYDTGRYANLNAQTVNKEYVSEEKVIEIIKALVDNDSYTEVSFIPDKYIINSVNISYGRTSNSLLQGAEYFQIKFYENSHYDVSASKQEEDFMENAIIKIKLGKMWEQLSDLDKDEKVSERNKIKLEKVFGIIFGERYKADVMQYILEKRIEAGKIENSETPKIAEVKKFGKYTINVWCLENQNIEIFIGTN